MGVQVSREFASSLIIACQNEASPNLGEHVLSQPEFLQAALAFAKAVRDFPGLPHEVGQAPGNDFMISHKDSMDMGPYYCLIMLLAQRWRVT
ncbi:hypothetical protein HYQ44_010870 [Verticillium longisporum]|nr:hypothetical protein HYQ44_010870 [Verticillium longisporum]